MAAGNFVVLDRAKEKIGAAINLATDSFQLVLTESAQALAANFAGGSGNAQYSDLTDEVTGTGYSAGGEPLANTDWVRSGSTVTFSADPTTWDTATFTAKYGVVVKSDGASPPTLSDIIGFVDLETTSPTGRSALATDFIVSWPTGVFDLD